MAAFLIVEISNVRDKRTYARYRDRVTPTLTAVGGQYLVRGGSVDVLEGGWRPSRMVVVASTRWKRPVGDGVMPPTPNLKQ